MFTNIKELIDLFEDEEVKKIIISSYYLSQEKNKELSDAVFEKFFILKKTFPNMDIIIDRNSTTPSNYNYVNNTIYLNGSINELTFFHELTHMISYDNSRFIMPTEYARFKTNFQKSKDRHSLLYNFIELCHQKKAEIINNTFVDIKYDYNNTNSSTTITTSSPEEIELLIIHELEDIVDALESGEPHDFGFHYTSDNNHIVQKSVKSAGHGCEYFSDTANEFEEILANYQSIKLLDPDNELFNLLNKILGNDFVSFLDDRCKQINSTKIINNRINNNINK